MGNKNSEAYVTNYTEFNINLHYFYIILFSSLVLGLYKNCCTPNFFIVVPCILIILKFFHQRMHTLLNI
jgi:hypothetical protein